MKIIRARLFKTKEIVNISLKFQTLISEIRQYFLLKKCEKFLSCFSSLGRSPGRAIILPPALAAASEQQNVEVFTLKFFMGWARCCQASYPVPVTGLV